MINTNYSKSVSEFMSSYNGEFAYTCTRTGGVNGGWGSAEDYPNGPSLIRCLHFPKCICQNYKSDFYKLQNINGQIMKYGEWVGVGLVQIT